MVQQTIKDDATPSMYCLHCDDYVPTVNEEWWTAIECAQCNSIDLMAVWEAVDAGLVP